MKTNLRKLIIALRPNCERPKRKQIPVYVKRLVCERMGGKCPCGCGQLVSWRPKTDTHFDHEPALRLRDILPDGSDYSPAQHDPKYIDARCSASHRRKTSGTGATTAGTDVGKIKKLRRYELSAAGNAAATVANPTKPAWGSRKLPSKPFPKSKKKVKR